MITKISKSAKIYADALIKTAQDGKMRYEDISINLETVEKILESSTELRSVLISPAVSTEQKAAVIDDVFKNQVHPEILNLLKLLAEKKRFGEFDSIVSAYKNELDEIQGIKNVTVISAIELSEDYKNKISAKLAEKLQKTIRADWQQDSSIIGGLVIQIDDNVIDTSIKNKLESLSKNIIKGNL